MPDQNYWNQIAVELQNIIFLLRNAITADEKTIAEEYLFYNELGLCYDILVSVAEKNKDQVPDDIWSRLARISEKFAQ